MIFADTNVVSETLRKTPDKHVLDWLIRFDAEIALPTVTIAETRSASTRSVRTSVQRG